ncbi:MAG TPA: SpoIIE family protein phosphatase [Rhodocyclaceae bacterium]|nr:SpoIIE family protein phosphatase [Rhodocyclaceae bacterium]
MINKPFKVLVADDTPANRTLLRAYLGRLGFEIVMAENGQEAVELFESAAPDMVLMDLMMPVMDGFEAIRRIRARHARQWVPIFVVSAMDAEQDVVRGLESGADDYLTKPLSYQVFAAKMRNMSRALSFQRAREDAIKREVTVSDAVIDGIVTFDITGSIVNLNRAASQIFAVSQNELTGRHFASLVTEDERPAFALELARCIETGAGKLIGRVAEVGACTPAGQRFAMELSISELPELERRLFIGVVRDISSRKQFEQQLADDANRLRQYHEEAESEADLAKEIMERHINRDDVDSRGAQLCVLPTARFSGDIVIAARSPANRLYALLADATGHGLAAAMTGLSVVNYFYQAVTSDTPLSEMVAEINASLRALLPSGRFVSAALVCVDDATRSAELWLGGVPDVLHIDEHGELLTRVTATHLPLGIVDLDKEDCVPAHLSWQRTGRLLLCSDGVIEASSPDKEEFGYAAVLNAVRLAGTTPALEALTRALGTHLQGQSAHDDISFLLLDLV